MSVSVSDDRKVLAVNTTVTSFAAHTPQTTAPATDTTTGLAVLDLLALDVHIGLGIPSYLDLTPFGSNANNETFGMRVYGWAKFHQEAKYTPRLLLDLDIVLGNIDAEEFEDATFDDCFMADTITVAAGLAESAFRNISSPAGDMGASVRLHTFGYRWFSVAFKADDGASASESCNCLWRPAN